MLSKIDKNKLKLNRNHYYKVILSYDGTDFFGWQIQPNRKTVQKELIISFSNIFKTECYIIGASRTDSGVHAKFQVALLKTSLHLDCHIMKNAWNNALPDSIKILKIQEVSGNFNPRYNVKYKIYEYILFLKEPSVFENRFGWFYKFIDKVDINKFKKILNLYEGTHNFASFCKQDKKNKKNTVRKIDSINIKEDTHKLIISIKGPGFLHYQIRRMIGYALDIARNKNLKIDIIKQLFEKPDSKQKFIKAAAKGLLLKEIKYKDE